MVPKKGLTLNGSGKWVAGISAAIFVAWAGWVSVKLHSVDTRVAVLSMQVADLSEMYVDLDTRLSVIQGNRFDSNRGLDLVTALAAHERLAGHPVMVERGVGMQVQLDRMERKIDALK